MICNPAENEFFIIKTTPLAAVSGDTFFADRLCMYKIRGQHGQDHSGI
jgi:hypothetical protein